MIFAYENCCDKVALGGSIADISTWHMFAESRNNCHEYAMFSSISSIPIYVRWCFASCGTVMAAFASQLPNELQTFGLWIGLGLGFVGLTGLIVHYLKWFFPKLTPPNWLNLLFPETIKRDTKMSEALAYVVAGKWGLSYLEVIGNHDKFGNSTFALVEMRQAALDSQVRVWGRTSNNGPFVEIPPQYWGVWQIEVFSALSSTGCKTEIAEIGHYGGTQYYELMVSKTEVGNRWPLKK
jgi:hypothetical protein